MIYKNFEDNITRKHGIVVEGWPLHTFHNPSAIGSQVELNVLLRAWRTGATRFRKMTEVEYMAWMESRGNAEPPSTAAAGCSPAIPTPEAQNQDMSIVPPVDLPAIHSSFDIISLESTTTGPRTSNGMQKKSRKTRSDKGKPRKKPSKVPGADVFHASTQ
jgi:hypothetical protein